MPDYSSVTIPFGSILLRSTDEVPGTGQRVADLLALGYTPDDISAMLESGAAAGLIYVPGPAVQYGPQQAPASSQLATPQTVQLPPGPSPRISSTPQSGGVLNSAMNFLTGSTLISGIPNFALLAGAVVLLPMAFGSSSGRRRR